MPGIVKRLRCRTLASLRCLDRSADAGRGPPYPSVRARRPSECSLALRRASMPPASPLIHGRWLAGRALATTRTVAQPLTLSIRRTTHPGDGLFHVPQARRMVRRAPQHDPFDALPRHWRRAWVDHPRGRTSPRRWHFAHQVATGSSSSGSLFHVPRPDLRPTVREILQNSFAPGREYC